MGSGQERGESSGVIDALVAAAPMLVRRRRQLLAAVDWSHASTRQLDELARKLAEHQTEFPAWLARDLVLAGHRVPAAASEGLSPDLRVLEQLAAAAEAGLTIDKELVSEAVEAARHSNDADAVAALVGRLKDFAGNNEAACRAALSKWPKMQKPLRQVRRQLPDFLATLPQSTVRIAGFSTTSTFAEALLPSFAAHGISIRASEAPFATAMAELLSPAPDAQATFLLLDPHALGDPDWRSDRAGRAGHRGVLLQRLVGAIEGFAQRASHPLVVNTIPAGLCPAMGHIDVVDSAGRTAVTRQINTALAELAATHTNIVLVDTDLALAALAPVTRHDPRLWFYGRIAYSEGAMNELAYAFATAFAALLTPPVKVVAIDLDNTAWGGVYGDDGIGRLACGDDPPGNAFKAFQAECLRLRAQGKLLVALSKNNADAISVFDEHPGMLLKPDDFAAAAIDWQPKPDNIRRLAAELDLGLDSFLFLDDSPHEREVMRRLCPGVRVPDMPADPALRPGWLRMLTETWPIRLTAEDAERPAMYQAERKARELKASAVSYDEYLRDLGQCLEIERLTRRTLPRVAQLHERTNQFNTTTRRFTESELAAFMADADGAVVLLGHVSDKFGDHGIVVAAVISIFGTSARIESFVMSCRVIARTIETAFLAAAIQHLAERGVTEVLGSYIPTAKNGLVRDLYGTHGFTPVETADTAAATWLLRAGADRSPPAPFVSIRWSNR